jgi:hypothetical protein
MCFLFVGFTQRRSVPAKSAMHDELELHIQDMYAIDGNDFVRKIVSSVFSRPHKRVGYGLPESARIA